MVSGPSRIPIDDVRAAASALRAIAPVTPLVRCEPLSHTAGVPVWLKCEQFQPIGAFKVRGAFTAISRLDPSHRAPGVVTHSSGNHGQAVAFVAKHLGIPATIVMPETAPNVKVNAIRGHGAEIVFTERVATARAQTAEEIARTRDLRLVPPYDDSNIIVGQGTCALEILEEHPDLHMLLVPVGGGGLLAGTAVAVQGLRAETRVVGVEPVGAPKLSRALSAGAPVATEKADSIADGLLPLSIGRVTFEYIQPVVRDALSVTDEEIVSAMKLLYWQCGIRVEPSGAVGVAALQGGHIRPTGPTAIVLSGGNVDADRFRELVS